MLRFIVYRSLYALLLLFVASVVIFYGLRVAPGEVTDVLTNAVNRIYMVDNLNEKLGLDKPLPAQYFIFMGNLLRGDPGLSLITGEPINETLREAGVYTLKLAAVAALFTYATAIPLGVLAAWKRNSAFDYGVNLLAVLGMAIPNFLLAIWLIQEFAVNRHWLPVAGHESWKHIILPAFVLSAEAIAINLRVVRASVLEELNRDYVRTLHAKGLSDKRILWMHVLRNALPPIIALAGIMLRTLLGYTLIVETIFRWPGLGSQLVNAVLKRDYTVAQTLAILLTAAVIFFNLLADIGQQWADPRVKTGIEIAVSSQQTSTVSEFDVPPEGTIGGAPDRTWRDSMAPLLANKLALLGAALTVAFLIISILGMAVIMVPDLNHLYLDQSLRDALLKPGEKGYLLGTDNLGRSLAWRLAAGTAVSLFAGFVVAILSITVGMILGCLAGYKGGLTDRVIGFLIDLTWGFPVILVAVILVGMLQPGLWPVILAISIVNWAGFARIVRAQAMSLNERAFVEAAHALGVPGWKIVLRHLVPNMLGTVLVMASYYIAVTVIAEAGLAFIGLGAQPPTPSLGQMVSNGRSFLTSNPWVVFLPGLVLALLVLGLNTLGDGLRDYFDPRLRRW